MWNNNYTMNTLVKSKPADHNLQKIWETLPPEPNERFNSNEPTEDQHVIDMHWEVDPGTGYGYRYIRVVEDMTKSFPRSPDDHDLRHFWSITRAQTLLGQSSIGDTMRKAGIFTEYTTRENRWQRTSHYHVAYPATENFVPAVNTTLREQGRNLRFSVFQGGKFPARLLTESAAEDQPTVPIGTEPRQNYHDMLTHGLGWLSLREKPFLFALQGLAQTAITDSSHDEQAYARFGDFVEGNVNSVWTANPYDRWVNFLGLADLTHTPVDVVLEDMHTFLYPDAPVPQRG
jgi:hypothetical protein